MMTNVSHSEFLRPRPRRSRLDDGCGDWMEADWNTTGLDTRGHRFLALQPIFNCRREIFGYEALSRSGWDNQFTGDSEEATCRMINAWMHLGPGELTGGSPTFINCTRGALLDGSLTSLPHSVVLELLETVEPDYEVVAACRKMNALGYQIALDDFQLSTKMEGLIELADYVKVDFRLSDKEQRQTILQHMKGRTIKFVGEKIETEEEFSTALDEGFELFQGYFLAHPTIFSRSDSPVCA